MSAANREPIKVAVIEDTPALGKLVRRIVDSMDGIQTFGVWENAEDGLKAIDKGPPDVVLMDISLPGMDGITATAKLKEKHPTERNNSLWNLMTRLQHLSRKRSPMKTPVQCCTGIHLVSVRQSHLGISRC